MPAIQGAASSVDSELRKVCARNEKAPTAPGMPMRVTTRQSTLPNFQCCGYRRPACGPDLGQVDW